MIASACPTDELLVAYGLGKISDADGEAVMKHLERCDGCRQRVAEMSGDSFVGRLKAAQGGTSLPDKSFAGLAASVGGPGVKASGLPPELANHPDYADVRELGRGGMGVVYLAQHRLMKRWEVLKVVGKEQLASRGAADRFLQEVQSAARLNHPNVVKAYSATWLGEMIAFSMEYVPGEDLAKVVKARGPLSVQHASFYCAQVAMGLQHAHDKGMVHRDIKPANLILTKDGNKPVVKILDFGLAKVTSEHKEDTGLTREGTMMGTPDFMAPEQWMDAAKADIRADIYSLGCTLYYLLTGRPPFQGISLVDLHRKHETQVARPLNLERPEVPPELAAVVAKMLAKEPGKRYQTPSEVAAALKPFVTASKSPSVVLDASNAGGTDTKPNRSATPVSMPKPPVPAAKPIVPATPKQENNVWETLSGDQKLAEPKTPRRSQPPVPKPRKIPIWVWPTVALGLLALGLGGMWAAGVFKMKTANGTIVVENVPDDAVVELDGGVLKLTRNGNAMTIQEVKEGEHTVKVTAGGVELLSRKVTVKLGGEPIHMRYEPKAPEPKPVARPTSENKQKTTDPIPEVTKSPTPQASNNTRTQLEQPSSHVKTTDGFLPLFNGKDLNGWHILSGINKGTWSVGAEGNLLGKGGGVPRVNLPAALVSDRKDYVNFRLRGRIQNNDGNGKQVWIRHSEIGADLYNGYGVMIGGTQTGRGDTVPIGSITKKAGKSATYLLKWDTSADKVEIPIGDWYTFEVEAIDNRIRSFVNGKQVAELIDDKAFATGAIWLVCRSDASIVCKDLAIQELTEVKAANTPTPKPADVVVPPEAAALLKVALASKQRPVPIVPPKDLANWGDQAKPTGTWVVEDNGTLVGSGSKGMTFPHTPYTDFYLKFEAMAAENTYGGMVVRRRVRPLPTEKGTVHTGYYVPVNTSTPSQTGRVSRWRNIREDSLLAASTVQKCLPQKWYRFEVVAVGSRIAVFVDGTFASFWSEPTTDALMLYKEGVPTFRVERGKVSFRNVEIKELDAAATATLPPPKR